MCNLHTTIQPHQDSGDNTGVEGWIHSKVYCHLKWTQVDSRWATTQTQDVPRCSNNACKIDCGAKWLEKLEPKCTDVCVYIDIYI